MTCTCPPHMCYYRPDCRRNKKPTLAQGRSNVESQRRALAHEAEARAHVTALGGDWLIERREALQEELSREPGWWTKGELTAKRKALSLVEAALERRGKV